VPLVSPWAMAAVFVAAMVSSVAGFAFSAICGAMLFHLVSDPVDAVQIMMVCSLGGQALITWSLRRAICWRALAVFGIGALVGLPIGIYLLLHTPAAPSAWTSSDGWTTGSSRGASMRCCWSRA
jgi:uncharacterized membrane protein YfcA